MANRYWVGNGGNWSDTAHWSTTTGGVSGASLPTSADSVYFDANSFTLTGQTVIVDVHTNCLDMDWTGALNTPSFANNAGYNQNIYGSLTLITNMLMSGTYGCNLTFLSTTTGKTVITSGKTCWQFIFGGVGGGWTLQDAVTLNSNMTVNSGTLDTNGKTISCAAFSSVGASTRSLTLGSSVITSSNNISFTSTGLTMTTNTATFKMTSNWTFAGGGLTFNNVEFQGSSTTITGSNTFNKLTLPAGKTLKFTAGTTQTMLDLDIGDNAIISSDNAGTSANLVFNGTSVTRVGANVTKTDIVVTTPNAPANKRYWVQGTGNWSDNTNHWSVLSGYFGGASLPTSVDNVYFNVNSFTLTGQTVTVDAAANCLDMDWTGATNSPTLAGSSVLSVYGSITFISTLIRTISRIDCTTTSTGKTITTAGISFGTLIFNGLGGGWTLQDAITATTAISIANGSVSTNFNVNTGNFTCSNSTATFNAGTITMTCTLSFTASTVATMTIANMTINMTGNSTTFAGGGRSYFIVMFSGTPITITASNTFNTLTLKAGKTVNLTAGTTQTVNNLVANGTSTSQITLQSATAGSPATITKSSGLTNLRHCLIKDIVATGGATFKNIAGTDLGGNTGISFVAELLIGQIKISNVVQSLYWTDANGVLQKISG